MDNVSREKDDIISYREMCDLENVQTLQRGMNYQLNNRHTVILMSQRSNAPYNDSVSEDGKTIEYEGHDESRSKTDDPKMVDQPRENLSGTLTQNGRFIHSIEEYKKGKRDPEIVRVYEKIMNGVWSIKGLFQLVDYKRKFDGNRYVYKFILELLDEKVENDGSKQVEVHDRMIPTEVKIKVWKRDAGKCVICGSSKNLHFDHDLPFSKGGTSLTEKNIRILCMKHNLEKSAKIQ